MPGRFAQLTFPELMCLIKGTGAVVELMPTVVANVRHWRNGAQCLCTIFKPRHQRLKCDQAMLSKRLAFSGGERDQEFRGNQLSFN